MPIERTDVRFPLWRKKVDSSMFAHLGTVIPNWVCQIWNISSHFADCSSKLDPRAAVSLRFQGKQYNGFVTVATHGRTTPTYRLWFSPDMLHGLKEIFLMTYMRDLDAQLRKSAAVRRKVRSEAEDEIPFWEFLDLEFDEANKTFLLKAHYILKPTFPFLFKYLQGTPALQRIEDSLTKTTKPRIYKQPWRPRTALLRLPEQENVIYYLLDTQNKRFYVGEAQRLKQRLNGDHASVAEWDHFRFDVLPPELAPFRLTLERMLIRAFASIMKSGPGVNCFPLSEYFLQNERIDG
jgi:hypothetical protein